MSSGEEYLKGILRNQEPSTGLKHMLQNTRDNFEGILREGIDETNVRFYYAGSYKKETMINESFDLDLVLYYPHASNKSLKDIYFDIKGILQSEGYNPGQKNVALQCNLRQKTYGSFHLDVVPGRAIDLTYEYANLYKSKEDTTLRTSVKKHVEAVKQTRHRDVIKLLKLWKVREGFYCPTFILEIIFMRYIHRGNLPISLPQILNGCFKYISDHIIQIKLIDPANSNNVVSNELSDSQKEQIQVHARRAYDAENWRDIFS